MKFPLNLYIHIPFCKAKCNYCHFFSFSGEEEKIPTYFRALEKELEYYSLEAKDREILTIYIGGGTPSIIEPKVFKHFISKLKNLLDVNSSVEITIEANPESISAAKVSQWLEMGINRISIGLEASQNSILKKLNRLYTIEEFADKLELVKAGGFRNINIDLIFAIPGQTLDEWKDSINFVTKANVQHISCYSLELDNDSYWGKLYEKGKLVETEAELDREMYLYAHDKLEEADFEHYEISNFAKANFRSQHNYDFWNGNEYLGLGAGAYSYFEGKRFHNIESLEKYALNGLKGSTFKVTDDIPNQSDQIFEYIMLRLRLLKEGINKKDFEKKFQTKMESTFPTQFSKLCSDGLLEDFRDKYVLSEKGVNLMNVVLEELLP